MILAVTVGGLGDAVLFSPVLKALRKRYRHDEILLLVASTLAQEAYASCREVNKTIFLPINDLNKIRQTTEFIKFGLKYRRN